VVGPGSQMLCYIAAALFTGPGPAGTKNLVVPRVPDYAGYQSLATSMNHLVGIASKTDLLDGRLFNYSLDYDRLRSQPEAGLILLSNPCNPTGCSIGQDDMNTLAKIAAEQQALLLVDNAYGAPFPQVAGTPGSPVWNANVINCFSASKAGLPGDRIGFAIGAKKHIDAMVAFIANTLLHAPQFPQLVLARALETGSIDELATTVVRPYYLARRRAAEEILAKNMPESTNWRLHVSDGGMFCWLWIDEPWFNDNNFYLYLKRMKIVVVPGQHFFPDPRCMGSHGTQCFRINVSVDEETVQEGIQRIAEALEELPRRL
jgi:valine--pyruvate aminotransferase